MRCILAPLMALVLTALLVAGIQAPAAASAAPTLVHRHGAPARPHWVTLTGSLVATPQGTNRSQSVNLLIQVGDRTVLVHVTGRTEIVDRNAAPISLGDLHDGAMLRVSGNDNGVKINAARVQDLSLPPPTVTVKGRLVAAPNPATMPPSGSLCLADTVITGASLPRAAQAASPCAAGQLPIYLTNSTRIENRAGGAITLADLKSSDTLQVTGALVSGKLLASMVMDMSR